MTKQDSFNSSSDSGLESGRSIMDPSVVLSLILRNWYWFVISIVIAMLVANLYLGHTLPVYRTSSVILINETGERTMVNNDELLQGLGLPGGLRNIENQIQILTSRSITERALRELPFEVEYYRKTFRNQLPLYPAIPAKIVYEGEIPLPRNIEFSISWLGNNRFLLRSEDYNFPFEKEASFGETISVENGDFRVSLIDQDWFDKNTDEKIYFIVYSDVRQVAYYNGRINVEPITRGGSMLRVSISGTSRAKDAEYLSKHIEIFQSLSLERKNIEADRRVQFIDEQLVGIADSLLVTENRLQQFRSINRVMDVSSQGQAIIGQMTVLENERARLKLEADYYDYLSDYLAKDVSAELPIVPITMGITDPGLTRLVTELADLQGQLISRGAGEMNPLQTLLAQRVRSAKDALLETLNGLRRANNLAMSENQERIDRINAQASALPVTERQLLGFERKFRLNDELYTFLLETRAEQQMQKASNTADSEIIEPVDLRFSSRVAPTPVKVYFVGILAGSGIPVLLILSIFAFDKRLREDDLKHVRGLSVLSDIPHNNLKNTRVVLDNPESAVAESFRLLRSKLQFFAQANTNPVILVTSAMPEDGKTFTAINLASVYSLLGKKTILVGFDLRKPRIYDDFGLKNDKGLSTYLIGQSEIEEIIQETSYSNLSVISAGPVPPNPAELSAREKVVELFDYLKAKYEFIIIDTSPIGIVSDTYHLVKLASTSIIVARIRKTRRDILEHTIKEARLNGIDDVSLILNDVRSAIKSYNFGEKYGYMSEKSGKKSWFRRRR